MVVGSTPTRPIRFRISDFGFRNLDKAGGREDPKSKIRNGFWGRSSVGRASGLQPEGRRFDSARLHSLGRSGTVSSEVGLTNLSRAIGR